MVTGLLIQQEGDDLHFLWTLSYYDRCHWKQMKRRSKPDFIAMDVRIGILYSRMRMEILIGSFDI